MRLKAYNKDRETESILRFTNQRNDKGERREACVRGKARKACWNLEHLKKV